MNRRNDPDAPTASLISLAARCASHGWTPATSGNFSLRLDATHALVTLSGRDKGRLTPADVVPIDLDAPIPEGVSAEAPVHVAVYRAFADVGAVVHVHTIAATVLSRRYLSTRQVSIAGWEMQKALRGVTTHEGGIAIPILPNTQDMNALARDITNDAARLAQSHGLLLAGHGLYAWGATPDEAFRHTEALDYLLTVSMHEEQLRR